MNPDKFTPELIVNRLLALLRKKSPRGMGSFASRSDFARCDPKSNMRLDAEAV
ncbi:MAG: hypothetical protein Q8881_03535 [Sweet potato little leaf phytoplasma]|nr:hypothetical protein [Sweet potato little leaf phytoplasma]